MNLDRKHLTKVTPVEHERGGAAGKIREHRDGRQDAKVLLRPVIHVAREHAPEQNARLLARLGYQPARHGGFVSRLPFSRDVIRHLESITGKRWREPA